MWELQSRVPTGTTYLPYSLLRVPSHGRWWPHDTLYHYIMPTGIEPMGHELHGKKAHPWCTFSIPSFTNQQCWLHGMHHPAVLVIHKLTHKAQSSLCSLSLGRGYQHHDGNHANRMFFAPLRYLHTGIISYYTSMRYIVGEPWRVHFHLELKPSSPSNRGQMTTIGRFTIWVYMYQ